MILGRRLASTVSQRRFFNSLSQIETRWGKLPEAEQGAIADKLSAVQKGDWKKMTLDEKRAAYFIAYGPYGARSPSDPALKWSVAAWSTVFVGLAAGLWVYTSSMKPKLRTMTPEWKAEEERISIEEKQNPYKGAYSVVRKQQQ
ncbi:Cytochrome c oxidase subunit 5A [Chytridiales sp. JEL 0842]|nr:Cytochrome c oxidase subunit 5A [Chytridiales sp. JEL 0842]